MNRIYIYTKDVQILTGKSEKYCRRLIKQIHQFKNKETYQPVTILDFCEYVGLDPQSVINRLK